MSGKIESIAGVGFAIFVLAGILCTGCGKSADKIETGAKRVLPSREMSAEKSQKIETEKDRIYASLRKWTDEWVQKNRSRLKKYDYYGSSSFSRLDNADEDIWVIADMPFHDENIHTEFYITCVEKRQFILHSPDNGRRWEIKWQAPSLHNYYWPIRLYRIQVVDKQRVCAAAVCADNPHGYAMLYTINGGKSWQIENKWDPRRIKRLSFVGVVE
jgi:hypothetical protein